MNATTRYINIFLSGLALVGTANQSLAAPDTGSMQDSPDSNTTGSENTEMSAEKAMPDAVPQSRPKFTGLWSLNTGAKLTQNYQFDAETHQLVIASVANLPDVKAVSYRLVYDRMKSGEDQ